MDSRSSSPPCAPRRLTRALLCCSALCASLASAAATAQTSAWGVDGNVGPSAITYTLEISCPAVSFTCSLLDGYMDVRVSSLSGVGRLLLDASGDTLQFLSDSTQDVGAGPVPAYLTFHGSDMIFATIPFAGVPEIRNLEAFSLSNLPISLPGLDLLTPGDHPFATTLSEAARADVTGDLEFMLNEIVLPPQPSLVTGTLRVLGDVDADNRVEYEIRDLSGALSVVQPGVIGGEPVDLMVTAVLSANLSGEVIELGLVPALGPAGLTALAMMLAALGGCAARYIQPRQRSSS